MDISLSPFGDKKMVRHLVCGWELHVIVEQVCIHREVVMDPLYAVQRLWRRDLCRPFPFLLLSFSSPVTSLFGAFGAQLRNVRGTPSAMFFTGFAALCGSYYCLHEVKTRQLIDRTEKKNADVFKTFKQRCYLQGMRSDLCGDITKPFAWIAAVISYIAMVLMLFTNGRLLLNSLFILWSVHWL